MRNLKGVLIFSFNDSYWSAGDEQTWDTINVSESASFGLLVGREDPRIIEDTMEDVTITLGDVSVSFSVSNGIAQIKNETAPSLEHIVHAMSEHIITGAQYGAVVAFELDEKAYIFKDNGNDSFDDKDIFIELTGVSLDAGINDILAPLPL